MSRTRKAAARTTPVRQRPSAPAETSAKEAAREAWMLLGRIYKAGKLPVWNDFQLSPSQAQLLYLVQPERPVPMNELANSLYCDASNVTGLVDKLEGRGLIERQPDPNDRRVKMIAVTSEGADFRAKVVDRAAEPPPAFSALSATEQRQLRDLLRKLANGMPEKP